MLNLMLLTLHASLLQMSANFIGFSLLGSVFGHFSIPGAAANEFYLKVCVSRYSRFAL